MSLVAEFVFLEVIQVCHLSRQWGDVGSNTHAEGAKQ